MDRDADDRVMPLKRLPDFQVAKGDPDVRGWPVLAADGREIGRVDELLVDTGAMKVRYLDVDLDDALGEPDRHVLIPIGYATLDRDADRVRVDAVAAADLAGVPAYTHDALTRDYERRVRAGYPRRDAEGARTGADDDFYADAAYDPDRFYAARRPAAPGTGLGAGAPGDPRNPDPMLRDDRGIL